MSQFGYDDTCADRVCDGNNYCYDDNEAVGYMQSNVGYDSVARDDE